MRNNKKFIKVGTLNCRGISKEDKQSILFEDIARYNLDVAALQETKIRGPENIKLRNRLKVKNEKKRQKEFFAKQKYARRMRLDDRRCGQDGALKTSLDLVSLQMANLTSKQFQGKDHVNPKSKHLGKVNMERPTYSNSFQRHVELPGSPTATPSRLQLEDDIVSCSHHVPSKFSAIFSCGKEMVQQRTKSKHDAPCKPHSHLASAGSSGPSSNLHGSSAIKQPRDSQNQTEMNTRDIVNRNVRRRKSSEDLFFHFKTSSSKPVDAKPMLSQAEMVPSARPAASTPLVSQPETISSTEMSMSSESSDGSPVFQGSISSRLYHHQITTEDSPIRPEPSDHSMTTTNQRSSLANFRKIVQAGQMGHHQDYYQTRVDQEGPFHMSQQRVMSQDVCREGQSHHLDHGGCERPVGAETQCFTPVHSSEGLGRMASTERRAYRRLIFYHTDHGIHGGANQRRSCNSNSMALLKQEKDTQRVAASVHQSQDYIPVSYQQDSPGVIRSQRRDSERSTEIMGQKPQWNNTAEDQQNRGHDPGTIDLTCHEAFTSPESITTNNCPSEDRAASCDNQHYAGDHQKRKVHTESDVKRTSPLSSDGSISSVHQGFPSQVLKELLQLDADLNRQAPAICDDVGGPPIKRIKRGAEPFIETFQPSGNQFQGRLQGKPYSETQSRRELSPHTPVSRPSLACHEVEEIEDSDDAMQETDMSPFSEAVKKRALSSIYLFTPDENKKDKKASCSSSLSTNGTNDVKAKNIPEMVQQKSHASDPSLAGFDNSKCVVDKEQPISVGSLDLGKVKSIQVKSKQKHSLPRDTGLTPELGRAQIDQTSCVDKRAIKLQMAHIDSWSNQSEAGLGTAQIDQTSCVDKRAVRLQMTHIDSWSNQSEVGSESGGQAAAKSQGPDVRLKSKDGTCALADGLPLSTKSHVSHRGIQCQIGFVEPSSTEQQDYKISSAIGVGTQTEEVLTCDADVQCDSIRGEHGGQSLGKRNDPSSVCNKGANSMNENNIEEQSLATSSKVKKPSYNGKSAPQGSVQKGNTLQHYLSALTEANSSCSSSSLSNLTRIESPDSSERMLSRKKLFQESAKKDEVRKLSGVSAKYTSEEYEPKSICEMCTMGSGILANTEDSGLVAEKSGNSSRNDHKQVVKSRDLFAVDCPVENAGQMDGIATSSVSCNKAINVPTAPISNGEQTGDESVKTAGDILKVTCSGSSLQKGSCVSGTEADEAQGGLLWNGENVEVKHTGERFKGGYPGYVDSLVKSDASESTLAKTLRATEDEKVANTDDSKLALTLQRHLLGPVSMIKTGRDSIHEMGTESVGKDDEMVGSATSLRMAVQEEGNLHERVLDFRGDDEVRDKGTQEVMVHGRSTSKRRDLDSQEGGGDLSDHAKGAACSGQVETIVIQQTQSLESSLSDSIEVFSESSNTDTFDSCTSSYPM